MKTQNSKSTILWKKLAIIPLMGGLIFLFADRVEAQTKKKPVVKEVKEKLNNANKLQLNYVDDNEATKKQMAEYKAIIEEVKKTQMVKFKDLNRARYIYGLMSQKQRKTVENIDRVIPPPPPIKVINGVMMTDQKKKLPPPPPKQVKKLKEVKVEKVTKPKKSEKSGWDLLEDQMNDPSLIKPNKDIKKEEEINFNWDNYEERVANIEKYRKKKRGEKKEVLEEKEIIEEREIPVSLVVEEVVEELKEKEVEVRERIKKGDQKKLEEKIIIEEVEVPLTEYIEEEVEQQESTNESYERMVEAGARFYLNGKKVSAKKIKPYFFEKKNKVRTFKVKDNNGDIKVRIKTRK